MKFKVGDRVIVVGDYYVGSHGTIIEADENNPEWPYMVNLDRHITLPPLRGPYGETELELE